MTVHGSRTPGSTRNVIATDRLPDDQRFEFRAANGELTGHTAQTAAEFLDQLRAVSDGSLRHHAVCGDFSNWIEHALHDPSFAVQVRLLEKSALSPRALRMRLLHAVEHRYVG